MQLHRIAIIAGLLFFSCINRGKSVVAENINVADESAEGSQTTLSPEEPEKKDNDSFRISSYTPDDKRITDDSYRSDADETEYEWDVAPDSRISVVWQESDTIGLCGHLELGKRWLYIDFPDSDQDGFVAGVQTGTTAAHTVDWLGDPLTVLSRVEKREKHGEFDIAFKEIAPEDFCYLRQTTVEDRSEKDRINKLIDKAIRSGRIVCYRNPEDTMRLQKLNRFSIGSRNLLIADYASSNGYCFVYVIEGDRITNLDLMNSYESKVHFFTIRNEPYILHSRSVYAGLFVTVKKMSPIDRQSDETIFKFGKSTD